MMKWQAGTCGERRNQGNKQNEMVGQHSQEAGEAPWHQPE